MALVDPFRVQIRLCEARHRGLTPTAIHSMPLRGIRDDVRRLKDFSRDARLPRVSYWTICVTVFRKRCTKSLEEHAYIRDALKDVVRSVGVLSKIFP